jgi:hypothetical protein
MLGFVGSNRSRYILRERDIFYAGQECCGAMWMSSKSRYRHPNIVPGMRERIREQSARFGDVVADRGVCE